MAQKWPSTEREFLRRFASHETENIHNLPPELKSASGSSWSAKHLQACRVLVQDHGACPPILNKFMATAREQVAADPSLLTSLAAFSRDELRRLSHRELRRPNTFPHFGSFFVSLADVARVPSPVPPSHRRLRDNPKPLVRPNFVSGEGFSSSPTVSSSPLTAVSSAYSPRHHDEQPDFEDQTERKKHEVVSANMAAQFISIVLDIFSSQPTDRITNEFSNAPTTFHLYSPQLSCTCQDDGSIWRREYNPITRTWINSQSKLLCSLEAKSSYFQADSSGIGATSDRAVAQQLCELLGSVLSEVIDGDYGALEDEERWSDLNILICIFIKVIWV
ncbi:MAG: hypothetical protein M1834_007113 [Cirrosporium novae-zelandiae]|nr:MAG: hypothetical protein M1834_007113 [Cirrosporium novae-zelandiae]